MKKILSLTLLFCLIALNSCENEGFPSEAENILFGSFAGHCFGNCFNAFQVDSSKVQSHDAEGHFTFDQYEFQPTRTLDKAAFTEARAIVKGIPSELIDSKIESYGCPDCADQGGYFVFFETDGSRQMVIIDTADTNDQSEDIIRFKNNIRDFIDKYRDQ
ncbi:hypothetical protein [Roseivirga sp.]|uniref:hypothetical protein n=1 Tax=Roseivirga sp. TaxID=1964215 RepID=UPI003B8C2757